MRSVIIFAALGLGLLLVASAGDEIKTPKEQFQGYATNIDEIPQDWITRNPIVTRVCFNLKHPINSAAADAFLQELRDTLGGLAFAPEFRLERTIRPVNFAYCVTLVFRNWEHNRRYETDEAFLNFYRERWKSTVTDMQEQLSVVDPGALIEG